MAMCVTGRVSSGDETASSERAVTRSFLVAAAGWEPADRVSSQIVPQPRDMGGWRRFAWRGSAITDRMLASRFEPGPRSFGESSNMTNCHKHRRGVGMLDERSIQVALGILSGRIVPSGLAVNEKVALGFRSDPMVHCPVEQPTEEDVVRAAERILSDAITRHYHKIGLGVAEQTGRPCF